MTEVALTLADLTGRTWKDSPTLNAPKPEPQWICALCGCGDTIDGVEIDHGICHALAAGRGYFGPL